MRYAELKARTNFSFLEGASSPEEVVRQAAQLGLSAIGLTDRNGVYGIPKAYQAKKDFPELKLLVGTELSLSGGRSLPVLARDRKAYGLLCRTLTASHADKPKGQAELSLEEFLKWATHSASSGWIALIDPSYAPDWLEPIHEALGERMLIALGRFRDGHDRKRTEQALALKKRFGSRLVATNEAHYHTRERQALHDVLTSIRIGKSLAEAGFKLFSNSERFLKTPQEMVRLFEDLPEAIENTTWVSDQCTFCPSELRYRYPSEWIPSGHTAQSYLEELVWAGAQGRYPQGISDKVRKQILHEFALIQQLGFADYFLTIYDIVDFAKKSDILCQGRGSAANSVVCYCLGITAIDPVEMNLLFERFISAERGEPPDIDVDFEHERREEVIQHIYKKYGRDRAAMVSAVITYQRRSSFREVSKALGVDVGTLSASKLQRKFEEASTKSGVPNCLQLAERLADEMSGFPRHLSIHSGGFTLSADPIIDIVPVEPARMEGRTIIQWDKYDLDYLGLLKVDVLSIGMLSAMKKTLDQVGLKLHEIPKEDPPTYEMIRKADVVGTFQIESRAQMSMLGRLQPKNFYDLVVEVAIVRPGPIIGKMVHPYLKRKRGEEAITYPDPRLKEILDRTMGVPLFQEQIMKIAVALAGFTPGEADELRRAIGAWRSTGSIEKMGRKLMEGLIRSGLPPEFAKKTFDQIQGFSQYGFPESHAASYAYLAYASAYLKCHYPAEFTCGLINSQPLGFYANHTLVDDAKRHGVTVLPVHPLLSEWDCTLVPQDGKRAIRLGLKVVEGLGEKAAHHWIEERTREPFKSLNDFLTRTRLRLDVLQSLAMGGALDCFGLDRRHTLWKILELNVLSMPVSSDAGQQLGLFSDLDVGARSVGVFSELSEMQTLREDYETYGLSTRGHPMTVLRKARGLPPLTIAEVREQKNGKALTISGLVIVRQRPPTAKGMTFATLEDETGFLDTVLHPPVFEKYREKFLKHCFVTLTGVVQKDGNTVSFVVRTVRPIAEEWAVDPAQYFSTMRPFGG